MNIWRNCGLEYNTGKEPSCLLFSSRGKDNRSYSADFVLSLKPRTLYISVIKIGLLGERVIARKNVVKEWVNKAVKWGRKHFFVIGRTSISIWIATTRWRYNKHDTAFHRQWIRKRNFGRREETTKQFLLKYFDNSSIFEDSTSLHLSTTTLKIYQVHQLRQAAFSKHG